MCVVAYFPSQCELLYVLGAMCLVGSFRWQCVLFGVSGGNVYFCMV